MANSDTENGMKKKSKMSPQKIVYSGNSKAGKVKMNQNNTVIGWLPNFKSLFYTVFHFETSRFFKKNSKKIAYPPPAPPPYIAECPAKNAIFWLAPLGQQRSSKLNGS